MFEFMWMDVTLIFVIISLVIVVSVSSAVLVSAAEGLYKQGKTIRAIRKVRK